MFMYSISKECVYDNSLRMWRMKKFVYDEVSHEWKIEEGISCYLSSVTCNSIRAFRRRLKKAPKGIPFLLVSRYRKCDVLGIGSKKNNKK